MIWEKYFFTIYLFIYLFHTTSLFWKLYRKYGFCFDRLHFFAQKTIIEFGNRWYTKCTKYENDWLGLTQVIIVAKIWSLRQYLIWVRAEIEKRIGG